MTVGGRPVDIATALAFRWACFRAAHPYLKRDAKQFMIGFAISTTAVAAGCMALVR